jgi:hypothetical protein
MVIEGFMVYREKLQEQKEEAKNGKFNVGPS